MNALTKNPQGGLRTRRSWMSPWDRFWNNDWLNTWDGDSNTIPSVNVREEDNSYNVEMAAPGLKKEDFKLNLDGDMLTISAEKKSESYDGKDKERYSFREYNYATFSRSFSLPENADPDKIDARYENGVLIVSIPKRAGTPKSSARQINVH